MKKLAKILSVFVLSFAVAALVACAPKNAEKAKAKMEKAGYTVTTQTSNEEDVVAYLQCVKGSGLGSIISGALDGNGLVAIQYSSSKAAKKAYNDTKDEDGKTNVTLVGTWVVYGSEEAVKAFKK